LISVTCEGIIAPIGTGPYKFDKKVTTDRTMGLSEVANTAIDVESGERVLEVHFVAHQDYWGGAPSIDRLVAHTFSDHDKVLAALLDGKLDMAYGSGVLRPEDYAAAATNADLVGHISPPVNSRLIAINSARHVDC
jgi:ABC-type transport system substrate-binding protein